MMIFKSTYVFIATTICTVVLAQVGDKCKVEHNGAAGVCKVGYDCTIAQEEAKIGIRPTLCGFLYNNIPVVCCEGATVSNVQANENSLINLSNNNADGFVYPEDDSTSNLPLCEQKCLEYRRLTIKKVQAAPLSTNGQPTTQEFNKCDIGLPLIVGGSRALATEFPFMAALGFNGDGEILWNCGGTLISEQFVMTAAHCADSVYGPPVRVRLGDLNLKESDDGSEPQEFSIVEIIGHPNYKPVSKHNDIALLKLSSKVKFSKFVRPACIWNKFSVNEVNVTATGWGRIEDGGDQSDVLMKVSLQLFENSRCDKTYKGQHYPDGIPRTMMCVGDLAGGKDTCQGDSGGPLIITDNVNQCMFYTIGITSFGKSCAVENTPAVYTRVSEFVSWIEKNVWK